MLVFSTQLCEHLPLYPSLWLAPPPPPPCVNKCTVYTYTVQCDKGCGMGSYEGRGPHLGKHLPRSPFTGQFF
jgi:hypothetical protein